MQVFELSNAISIHVETIRFCKRNALHRKRKLAYKFYKDNRMVTPNNFPSVPYNLFVCIMMYVDSLSRTLLDLRNYEVTSHR